MAFHPDHLLQVLSLPPESQKVPAAPSDVSWSGQTAFPNPMVSCHQRREELRGAGCVEGLEKL